MEKNKVIYTKNTIDANDKSDIVLLMNELSRWLYSREFVSYSLGGSLSLKKIKIEWDENYSKEESHYIIFTTEQNKKIKSAKTNSGIPYSRYLDRMINDVRNNGINIIMPIVDNISDSESECEDEVDDDDAVKQ
jgi:hypothetical protein